MGLSDYTVYEHANTVGVEDTNTAIVETQSFRLSRSGGTGATGAIAVRNSPKGFVGGKLRMLFRWQTGPNSSSAGVAIFCMQSNEDIVNNSSNFYRLWMVSNSFQIRKVTAGTILTAGSTLASTSIATSNNVVYACEFQWFYRQQADEVGLVVRRGLQSDFSDLSTIITFTDTSSPFTTSEAEGFGFVDSTAGFNFVVNYDTHEFRRIIVGG